MTDNSSSSPEHLSLVRAHLSLIALTYHRLRQNFIRFERLYDLAISDKSPQSVISRVWPMRSAWQRLAARQGRARVTRPSMALVLLVATEWRKGADVAHGTKVAPGASKTGGEAGVAHGTGASWTGGGAGVADGTEVASAASRPGGGAGVAHGTEGRQQRARPARGRRCPRYRSGARSWRDDGEAPLPSARV
jgi:hypothetical protein